MKKKIWFLIMFVSIFLSACSNTDQIKTWDNILIYYTWTLENWKVVDVKTTSITVWSWKLIEWIEKTLIWMKIWQSKKISIKPELWYGSEYSSNKIQEVSKVVFDKLWIDVAEWKTASLWDIEWTIKWIKKDEKWNEIVIFDSNSEKTRKNINYEIKILK